jgi:hypothetical protein
MRQLPIIGNHLLPGFGQPPPAHLGHSPYPVQPAWWFYSLVTLVASDSLPDSHNDTKIDR